MFLETVSLNDDVPPLRSGPGGRIDTNATTVDVDRLEAQQQQQSQAQQQFPHTVQFHKNGSAQSHHPLDDSDDADDDDNSNTTKPSQVAINVNGSAKSTPQRPAPARPTLPPLRVAVDTSSHHNDVYTRDTVDPTLFSPEVSRRAVEVARGRAKTLEMELKELALLDAADTSSAASSTSSASKLSPVEAVGIISQAFVASLARVQTLVTRGTGAKEYDLLSGTSPSARIDDLDTDGDGLQLSPDNARGHRDGQHFASRTRSALKRISAYAHTDKVDRSTSSERASALNGSGGVASSRRIVWHDDVLDHDEEFVDEDEGEIVDDALPISPGSNETASLMVNGSGAGTGSPSSILHYKNDRLTPRSKKKRKKLVKSLMRRLTPSEKEELYRQRPDLMIVPNWAQKYRQGLEEDESSRWSLWLVAIIATLAALLLVLIILIAKERAAAGGGSTTAQVTGGH